MKNCPICESTNFKPLKTFKISEGILNISRYNNCSVSFSSRRFTGSYLIKNYYQEDYEENIVEMKNYEYVLKIFKNTGINVIRPWILKILKELSLLNQIF